MKMNYHILFLIVIIGIISVGVVGANVFNSDSSMKKEVLMVLLSLYQLIQNLLKQEKMFIKILIMEYKLILLKTIIP